MIIYNVTVTVDKDIEQEWLRWMKAVHIPDVMKTKLFVENKICKVLDDNPTGTSFAIQYSANSLDDIINYQDNFSKRLQADHTKRYQGKFAAFRTLLEVV